MMSIVKIDPQSPLPLYAQLESLLAAEIAAGTLPPGSRLPNEEELVKRYAVSRTTVRQTIQHLIRRGLIEIRRGKGTFVFSAARCPPDCLIEITSDFDRFFSINNLK